MSNTFTSGNSKSTSLAIYGSGFGTVKPTVPIGGLNPAIPIFTDTQVNVTLSQALRPGDYRNFLRSNVKGGDDGKRTTSLDPPACWRYWRANRARATPT